MQGLIGKTAIVTGSSRGIGLAVARRLAAEGVRVTLTARKPEALEEAVAAIVAEHGEGSAIAVAGNAGDAEHRREAVATTLERFGSVDLLVNNTGINPTYGPLMDLDHDAARKTVDVNGIAALAFVQECHRVWMGEHGGAVVNVASVAGVRPAPGIAWYGATKALLISLTQDLAVELGPSIRVDAVAPAVVRTRFATALFEGREEEVTSAYPLKRLGEPEDVGGAVAFLLSSDASWVTGQTLVLDGGVTLTVVPEMADVHEVLSDRGVVVTGAGRGIGRALATRAAAEGARVVVNDLDAEACEEVAAEIGATALPGDCASPEGVTSLVTGAEQVLGRIDVYFANAGIDGALGTTAGASLEAAEEVLVAGPRRQRDGPRAAARVLVPRWLESGGGRMVLTASAAGLLSMIGSAPYSVTKHAAVAFAEWLSITYGDRGVAVQAICPQGVATRMLDGSGPLQALLSRDAALAPEAVAEAWVASLADDRFLVLPHPEVHDTTSPAPPTPTRGWPACAGCSAAP